MFFVFIQNSLLALLGVIPIQANLITDKEIWLPLMERGLLLLFLGTVFSIINMLRKIQITSVLVKSILMHNKELTCSVN